jgi:hypothetical protein
MNLRIIYLVISYILVFLPMIGLSDCPTADMSGDCIVDIADLFLFAENWLSDDLPQHPGLVAHWELNELEGEIASELIGGFTGQLHGNPQWMPSEGYFQGALLFDGVDDYIKVPGYNGIGGANARTVSLWINTENSSQIPTLVQWGSDATEQLWMLRIQTNGTIMLAVFGGGVESSRSVTDGQWHHIVAILPAGQTDSRQALLYIDGQFDAVPLTVSCTVDTTQTVPVHLGAWYRPSTDSYMNYYSGLMDDVRIYNQSLMSEEVLRLFQTGTVIRHSPDFTLDSKVDIQDLVSLAQQWLWEEPAVVISEFLASNDAANPPDASQGQIRDGDGDSSDWIELYNQTDSTIDVGNWGLTDDEDNPFKWRFPAGTLLEGRSFLIVFASDKYPYADPLGYLHTNFKLSAEGEYLAMTRPDGTVEHRYNSVLNVNTGEYGFPNQKENISCGMLYNEQYYFPTPTPGQTNRQSSLGFVGEPQFSHERGFYEGSFSLTLTTETPDAVIRYTTDGTDPTLSSGTTYTTPITINNSTSPVGRYVRAAAFKPGYQTSPIKTKTYLMNATIPMKGLPAVCLSGSPTEVFYNPNGIMAIVGGMWGNDGWYKLNSTDYNNVIEQGMDYERPVSMEYIRLTDSTEFQEDCGIRVHGSAWMRPRYTLPPISGSWSGSNKYSFRLYFRSNYGNSKFLHSVITTFPEVEEMDNFVLRAGHNDQTNPFVRDEMIRRLQYRMGNQASRGTFVNLFVNSIYKGYYNLCEHIGEDFCRQWFNSTKEWDVVGWVVPGTGSYLEARDGDMVAFTDFINLAQNNNLTNPLYYAQVEGQMDMAGFVDYIILQCWGGNWDWPQNNWSAAAERSPQRKWRFFVWDAEGAMDTSHGDALNQNRFSTLNSDGSGLSKLFRALKVNDDFKMLFTDRLQKHFLDTGGAMTKSNLTSLFSQLAGEVQSVIPSIDTYISNTYIPGRESIFFSDCVKQGLFAFAAPRIFLNGKETQKDYALENSRLTMDTSGVSGDDVYVYYTLDGTDPRVLLSNRAVTLVAENAPKRAWVPTANIGTEWRTQTAYNDTSWTDGLPVDNTKTGGVGYENNSVNIPYISYNVASKMYKYYTSAYIRIPFTLNAGQIQDWNYLTLKMRYDDGFVAYINGVEVYRRGFSVNGTPAWNSTASSSHENSALETFVITNFLGALQAGQNILAIQGLNRSKNSSESDFVISAILEAGCSSSNGISPRASKYISPVTLSKSVYVKARTLNGTQWSAIRETLISFGSLNENLRISEIMYHPNGDPNEEFVEMTNIGTTALNLNEVSFTDGIQFTFSDTTLGAGQFLLLAANRDIFESRYGTGLPIAGTFEGALDNAGEKLQLSDILGNPIQTIDYKDTWYELTDGDGFSLTAVDPAYEKTGISQTNLEARWTFNETSGVTVNDTTGHYPGTIYNMQDTSRVYGREVKALVFDGVNDYVKVPGYNGIGGANARTVSLWIKTTSSSTVPTLIQWGSDTTGQLWMLRIQTDGTVLLAAYNGGVQSIRIVTDNQWHHITAVLPAGQTNSSQTLLYIDGQVDAVPLTVFCTVNTTQTVPVHLGAWYKSSTSGYSNYYSGLMDDVRIYSRALEADEVSALVGSCWDRQELWRPSAIRGGTPGRAETTQETLPLPGAIVIHELLAHSHSDQLDWIELYNTTSQNIDISGWFLSDSFISDTERKKYQIPAGTILTPASPFYVVEEDHFNNSAAPGCRIPFALSEGGETLYLQSAQGEQLTGYFTKESFDATQTDVSLGRFQKSYGSWNFVPMSVKTKGAANAYPKVGPIIISEMMYNPGPNAGDQDYEYLELMNISAESVQTANEVSTYSSPVSHIEEWIPWKFTDGIQFEFPVDLQIEPGQRILLVKKRTAFDAHYTGVPAGTVIYEWTGGNLANEGETVQLAMAGDQEYLQDRYYIREDRVNYDEQLPWPPQANGTGKSMTHLHPTAAQNNYTNDPIHWAAEDPSPGW